MNSRMRSYINQAESSAIYHAHRRADATGKTMIVYREEDTFFVRKQTDAPPDGAEVVETVNPKE